MCQEAYQKLRAIPLLAETDPEYQALEERRRAAETEFLSVIRTLERQQRETILEYLGILQEQGLRELELACFAESDKE